MQTVSDVYLLIDVVWCDLSHDSPGAKKGGREYMSCNLWSLRCDDEDDNDELDDDEGDDDEDDDEDDQLILIGLNLPINILQ